MKQTCYKCGQIGDCLLVFDLDRPKGPIWVEVGCMTSRMRVVDGDVSMYAWDPQGFETLGISQQDYYRHVS
jgi:hypothetical protein